jgi:hypothetical protein
MVERELLVNLLFIRIMLIRSKSSAVHNGPMTLNSLFQHDF